MNVQLQASIALFVGESLIWKVLSFSRMLAGFLISKDLVMSVWDILPGNLGTR